MMGSKRCPLGSVTYDQGCDSPSCHKINGIDDIKRDVSAADVAIVCVGLSSQLESEGNDRQKYISSRWSAESVADGCFTGGNLLC